MKRIVDLPLETTIYDDDYVLIDSEADGERKIKAEIIKGEDKASVIRQYIIREKAVANNTLTAHKEVI